MIAVFFFIALEKVFLKFHVQLQTGAYPCYYGAWTKNDTCLKCQLTSGLYQVEVQCPFPQPCTGQTLSYTH